MARLPSAMTRFPSADPEATPCLDCGGVDYVIAYPEHEMVCEACGLVNPGFTGFDAGFFQNRSLSARPAAATAPRQPRAVREALREGEYGAHVVADFRHVLSVYRGGTGKDGGQVVQSTNSRLGCLQLAASFHGYGCAETFCARHGLDPRALAKAVKRVKEVLMRNHEDARSRALVEKLHAGADAERLHVSRGLHDLVAVLAEGGMPLPADRVRAIKFRVADLFGAFRAKCFQVFISRSEQIVAAGVVKYVLYHSDLRVVPELSKRAVGEAIVVTYGVSQPSIDFVVNYLKRWEPHHARETAPPDVLALSKGAAPAVTRP